MNVQVKDRLACLRVCINDGSIACAVDALLLRHPPDHGQQVAEESLVLLQILVERNDVFAGNDEQVYRALGLMS